MNKPANTFHLKNITRHTLAALLIMSAASAPTAIAATGTAAPKLKSEPLILSSTDDVVVERIQLGDSPSAQNNAQGEVIIAQANVNVNSNGNSNGNERVIIKQINSLGGLSGGFETMMSEALSSVSGGGLSITSTKSIKNAPYSAEVISEKIQNLPDGNQIIKRTTSLAYRDSAGRTRQETRNDKNELRSIHINDAVENTRYVLSPSQKTATKISFDKDISKKIEALRAQDTGNGKHILTMADGKSVNLQTISPGGIVTSKHSDGGKEVTSFVTIKKFDDSTTGAVGAVGNAATSTININGSAVASQIGDAMRGAGFSFNFEDGSYAAKASTRELGAKSFDGVAATGKVVSYTIPAGEVGNKNPITVSTETWYSPDLQVTLYSKKSDPRNGETIYRLANIKRTEQPLTLFVVPSDYALKEAPSIAVKMKELK